MMGMEKGFVYLVGAGPGRADLITVRGAEVLKQADCIIYDKLANPALLKFARADAEILHVPKRIGGGSVTQEEINRLLVEKSAGRIVVRLKGGDPCIFGRIAEEIAVLSEAGIGFEIVPGVTAGIALSSYSGIMLTVAHYRLPGGRVIHPTTEAGSAAPGGIHPDVEVPLNKAEVHAIQESRRALDLVAAGNGDSSSPDARKPPVHSSGRPEIVRDRQLLTAMTLLGERLAGTPGPGGSAPAEVREAP